jgi:hypothetical protein
LVIVLLICVRFAHTANPLEVEEIGKEEEEEGGEEEERE